MNDALEKRLSFALAAMAEAGRMALQMRPPPGGPVGTLKGTADWLTEADATIERFLAEQMRANFPEDGFQGEEDGVARAGTLRWVVDPIDGTSNYARGNPRFCVSIGLIEDRMPLLGVLVAPAMGEVLAARHGGGATLNGAPIHAADTTDPKRAMVEVGWSPRRPDADFLALTTRLMAGGTMMRNGGSGAMGLADVATGRLDGYVEAHINLWDVAGALPILAEAGALLSDFMAEDGPTVGAPILAAAPGLFEHLSAIASF